MKLYTVTVQSEFVMASESDDIEQVQREAEELLRKDMYLRDELEGGDVSASPMSCLPGDYDMNSMPYGVADDRTIGDMIAAGCAPRYTDMQAKLISARASMKVTP